jgi:hypothetical protein
MSDVSCERCDAPLPDDHFKAGWVWVASDDGPVCPAHLTPAEKAEAFEADCDALADKLVARASECGDPEEERRLRTKAARLYALGQAEGARMRFIARSDPRAVGR